MGWPPFFVSCSASSTIGLSFCTAERASIRQLVEFQYPAERKMSTSADTSIYSASLVMSSKSSTSLPSGAALRTSEQQKARWKPGSLWQC
eukprot:5792224-Prymnesium_polylepis.1